MKSCKDVCRIQKHSRNITVIFALKLQLASCHAHVLLVLLRLELVRFEFIVNIFQRPVDAVGKHVQGIKILKRTCIVKPYDITDPEAAVDPRLRIKDIIDPHIECSVRQGLETLRYVIQRILHLLPGDELLQLLMIGLSVTHHRNCQRKKFAGFQILDMSFHHKTTFRAVFTLVRKIETEVELMPFVCRHIGKQFLLTHSLNRSLLHFFLSSHIDAYPCTDLLESHIVCQGIIEQESTFIECRKKVSSGIICDGLRDSSASVELYRIPCLEKCLLRPSGFIDIVK